MHKSIAIIYFSRTDSMLKISFFPLVCVLGLTACSGVPLESYAPVVDTYSVDLAKYNQDIA